MHVCEQEAERGYRLKAGGSSSHHRSHTPHSDRFEQLCMCRRFAGLLWPQVLFLSLSLSSFHTQRFST